MKIGTRQIGSDHPPYIIAEIGVNHDGSPARALELVRLAAGAGADAVKFQLFEADRLMSRAAKLAAYQKAAGESDPIEMLRRLELSIDDLAPCVALAHELSIHAIVSVFSVELVPIAERLAWDAYKTASPDILNKPLLDALAATGKPLIVSTGASNLDEVGAAATWLRPLEDRVAFLHCVSCYPTEPADAQIRAMKDIGRVFKGVIGYSDHTREEDTGNLARWEGAEILEKHLTHSRNAAGPDHAASLDPHAFARYVTFALKRPFLFKSPDKYDTEPRMGTHSCRKRVLDVEQDVRAVSRQSLTTTRSLPAGHALSRSDLTIKRPGTGIPPFEFDAVIGKRTSRALEADMPLLVGDLIS